ncbi:MAG TPA: helix-turn-helix domain-containing protein [Thermoanaerobaculia bacterium]|nr:helix-turn-helix domain-containing protein [Thermoanaerobaculia bacterium]
MGRPARVSRDAVLRAAREAFAERGFDGTTLASIGARVGLSPSALLRHAPTKEALFTAAMSAPVEELSPIEFMADARGDEDPAQVLRRIAFAVVPFIEAKLGESIARWQRARTADEARTLKLPFDPRKQPSPPARALALTEQYFRRASRAGRLSVRDSRAAALAFLGSLNAYVFLQRVMRIPDSPVPLRRYVDTLLAIWSRGAIRPARTAAGRKSS